MHCRWCNYWLTPEALPKRDVQCISCNKVNTALVRAKKGFKLSFPQGRLVVRDAFNPRPRKGKLMFWHESYNAPGLVKLRETFDHADAMKGQKDEFHQHLALMNWFNRRITSSAGIEVMQNGKYLTAMDEKNGFYPKLIDCDRQACSGYTYRFVCLAGSLGHTARSLNILSEDTGYGKHTAAHVIVEMWSNQYAKWIAMDTLFNQTWHKDGIPLSGLEIRDEYFRNGGRDVKTRWGLSEAVFPRVDHLGPTAGHPMKFAWYSYISTNAFLSFPLEDKLWRAVLFRDKHNKNKPFTNWPAAIRRPYAGESVLDETTDRDDIEWPVNLTQMNVTHVADRTLHVHLLAGCPNFSHFETKLGQKGKWQILKSANKPARVWPDTGLHSRCYDLDWQLKEGVNRLAVRAVNAAGVAGHESFFELEWSGK